MGDQKMKMEIVYDFGDKAIEFGDF